MSMMFIFFVLFTCSIQSVHVKMSVLFPGVSLFYQVTLVRDSFLKTAYDKAQASLVVTLELSQEMRLSAFYQNVRRTKNRS